MLGYAGMNNFYLYRLEKTTMRRLFVWDQDHAFLSIASGVKRTDDNVLFRRAMADPQLRNVYFTTLENCARTAAADDFLLFEIDRLVAIVFDAVRSDTATLGSDAAAIGAARLASAALP